MHVRKHIENLWDCFWFELLYSKCVFLRQQQTSLVFLVDFDTLLTMLPQGDGIIFFYKSRAFSGIYC